MKNTPLSRCRKRPIESPLQKALVEWLKPYNWDTALTFTFPSSTRKERAERQMKRYWNKLDAAIFGPRGVKKGQHVQRASFVESGVLGDNWHYHAVALAPAGVSQANFMLIVDEIWNDPSFEGFRGEFDPTHDPEGWLIYVSKYTSRDTLAFDLACTAL